VTLASQLDSLARRLPLPMSSWMDRQKTKKKGGDQIMKKFIAFALALSFAALLTAPSADAAKGRGGHDDPPECQVKKGVVVCK
jgi:hypothetical protein